MQQVYTQFNMALNIHSDIHLDRLVRMQSLRVALRGNVGDMGEAHWSHRGYQWRGRDVHQPVNHFIKRLLESPEVIQKLDREQLQIRCFVCNLEKLSWLQSRVSGAVLYAIANVIEGQFVKGVELNCRRFNPNNPLQFEAALGYGDVLLLEPGLKAQCAIERISNIQPATLLLVVSFHSELLTMCA